MDKIIKNFEKNGFFVKYFDTYNQANHYLYEKIQNTEVTFGGSQTTLDMGLHKILAEKNQTFYHGASYNIHKNPIVFICSANALSKDGKIVNIDDAGNRISATSFGPSAVYIICGVNKIEENLEKALYRAKNIACPLNARRLNRNTPCVKGELKCYNCSSLDRICNVTSIIEKKPTGIDNFEIILINQKLGF